MLSRWLKNCFDFSNGDNQSFFMKNNKKYLIVGTALVVFLFKGSLAYGKWYDATQGSVSETSAYTEIRAEHYKNQAEKGT